MLRELSHGQESQPIRAQLMEGREQQQEEADHDADSS